MMECHNLGPSAILKGPIDVFKRKATEAKQKNPHKYIF